MRIIADIGLDGLTIRAIAKELGGSLTLVTHYFASREDVLADLSGRLISEWKHQIEDREVGLVDPLARLYSFLTWNLSNTEKRRTEERARFQLLGALNQAPVLQPMFEDWDHYLRGVFRDRLEQLTPPSELEVMIDSLRSLTAGIVLMTREHDWSDDRQHAALNKSLQMMGLLHEAATEATKWK